LAEIRSLPHALGEKIMFGETPPDAEKLGKREITDILVRNAELFRNEENFAQYLAELAIYLIRFQYDPRKDDPDAEDSEDSFAGGSTHVRHGFEVIYNLHSTFHSERKDERKCPFCDTVKPRELKKCPVCGL
jgi:hypothetical protein